MRTTIDLPEDLHRILGSLSLATRRTMSDVAAELLRRGLSAEEGTHRRARVSPLGRDRVTGLPLVRLPRTIAAEDVAALDDEA